MLVEKKTGTVMAEFEWSGNGCFSPASFLTFLDFPGTWQARPAARRAGGRRLWSFVGEVVDACGIAGRKRQDGRQGAGHALDAFLRETNVGDVASHRGVCPTAAL